MKLTKDIIVQIIVTLCNKRHVDEEDMLGIDVYTRQEYLDNFSTEPTRAEDERELDHFIDGERHVDFVLMYNDHPDYCYICAHHNEEAAYHYIDLWFDEIKIK